MNHLCLSAFLVGAAAIGAGAPLFAGDVGLRPFTDPENCFSRVKPEGWQVDGSASPVRLDSAEGGTPFRFGMSDARKATDAIMAAWAAAGETAAIPHTVTPALPRDGLDAATVFANPPDGHVIRQAVVEDREGRLHVTLDRGTVTAPGQRGTQVNIAVAGFRSAGVAAVDPTGITPPAVNAADMDLLDAYVDATLARFHLPGAVIAVPLGAEERLPSGFEARARGFDDSMTPASRRMIGSVGKTMTTLLTAQLGAEGRLSSDQPVRDILPEFAAGDQVRAGAEHCVVNVAPDDPLNLRAGPGTGKRVVARLPYARCGLVVTAACTGDWCPVEDGHNAGWVNRRYIAEVSRPANCLAPPVHAPSVALRAWPSDRSRILARLSPESCGIALLPYRVEGWQKIRQGGREGWVRSTDLRKG